MKKVILILMVVLVLASCKKNKVDTIDDVIGNYTWYSYTEYGKTDIINARDYITITKDSIRINTQTYKYDFYVIENETMVAIISDRNRTVYSYENGDLIDKNKTYSSIYKKQ